MKITIKAIVKRSTFIILFQCLMLFTACSKNESDNSFFSNSSASHSDMLSSPAFNAIELEVNKDGLSLATATIKTIHGNIVIKFYPKHAPNTITRFIQLANKGFYDGLNFHRVIEGFVIQTGDPTGTGKGGSGIILKAEFNSLQHIKGTVAMARSHNDIDSADSQFYIALTSLPHLDGDYTIFGQVTEGLDVLDQIKLNDKILSIHISSN